VPVDIAVSCILTFHIKIIKHKNSPPTMVTVKIVTLLITFKKQTTSVPAVSLKSLSNHPLKLLEDVHQHPY